MKSLVIVLGSLLCSFSLLVGQPGEAATPFDSEDDGFSLEMSSVVGSLKNPTAVLRGGVFTPSFESWNTGFKDQMYAGIMLGSVEMKSRFKGRISKFHQSGLDLGYFSASEGSLAIPAFKVWRFGFNNESGYGYEWGEGAGIYLLSGGMPLSWTVFDYDEDSEAVHPLDRLGNSLRFGNTSTGSIVFKVFDGFGIKAGATWTQVYPRYLFWYWAGSGVIEGISSGLADAFVKSIADSSPKAVPIVHFLLHNGINTAFKALRSKKMNWPFDTEPSLNMIGYEVGLQFIF